MSYVNTVRCYTPGAKIETFQDFLDHFGLHKHRHLRNKRRLYCEDVLMHLCLNQRLDRTTPKDHILNIIEDIQSTYVQAVNHHGDQGDKKTPNIFQLTPLPTSGNFITAEVDYNWGEDNDGEPVRDYTYRLRVLTAKKNRKDVVEYHAGKQRVFPRNYLALTHELSYLFSYFE
jgi:hypothetical protein